MGSARKAGGALVGVVARPEAGAMPVKAGAGQEDEVLRPIDRPANEPHEGLYVAALITPLGIRPVVDAADVAALKQAQRMDTPAMLFGLSVDAMRADQSIREPWLSNGGIVAPDGLALFDLSRIDVDG